jgi:predicted aconitase with swiveling domain
VRGRPVVEGAAAGEALVSTEPLSFWGGYDQRTGEIIDRRHPMSGQIAAGRVLAVPAARGSSTTTAVLLESVRAGTAPVALITSGPDRYLALASIVAEEMYGVRLPVVSLQAADFARLRTGDHIAVTPDGALLIGDEAQPDPGTPRS